MSISAAKATSWAKYVGSRSSEPRFFLEELRTIIQTRLWRYGVVNAWFFDYLFCWKVKLRVLYLLPQRKDVHDRTLALLQTSHPAVLLRETGDGFHHDHPSEFRSLPRRRLEVSNPSLINQQLYSLPDRWICTCLCAFFFPARMADTSTSPSSTTSPSAWPSTACFCSTLRPRTCWCRSTRS